MIYTKLSNHFPCVGLFDGRGARQCFSEVQVLSSIIWRVFPPQLGLCPSKGDIVWLPQLAWDVPGTRIPWERGGLGELWHCSLIVLQLHSLSCIPSWPCSLPLWAPASFYNPHGIPPPPPWPQHPHPSIAPGFLHPMGTTQGYAATPWGLVESVCEWE